MIIIFVNLWPAISREATDTRWMDAPCADAGGCKEGTRKRIGKDDRVANSLTQGQAGAES